MYKEKKPLYVDPFDFQAHMFLNSLGNKIRPSIDLWQINAYYYSLCRQAGK